MLVRFWVLVFESSKLGRQVAVLLFVGLRSSQKIDLNYAVHGQKYAVHGQKFEQ